MINHFVSGFLGGSSNKPSFNLMNDLTEDNINLSDDSDDSIIIGGLKDSKSLNRINIMTMNESFKKSDTSLNNIDKSCKGSNEKSMFSSKCYKCVITVWISGLDKSNEF